MAKKKQKIDYQSITLKDIQKAVTEAFYGKAGDKKPSVPFVKKYDDGTYQISSGQGSLWTKQGGYDLFVKAMQEQGKKL